MAASASHADTVLSSATPTRCSAEWCHANAEVQPSVFAEEATPSASSAVVMLDGELGVSDDKAPINVGGFSLFMEPCVDVIEVEKMPLEDVVWYNEISGHVLTLSAAVTGPSEPLLNPPMQLFAIFEPDNPTLPKCATECFDDDVNRAMSMFSQVPMCDDADDLAAYALFEEVLQRDDVEWTPWPPPSQVHIIVVVGVLGTMPPWWRSASSLGESGTGDAHCVFDKAKPWRGDAFQPGRFATNDDRSSRSSTSLPYVSGLGTSRTPRRGECHD